MTVSYCQTSTFQQSSHTVILFFALDTRSPNRQKYILLNTYTKITFDEMFSYEA